MTPIVYEPLRIFCSYSRKDEAHVNDLRNSLRGLERQGLIEWWHDREIVPGWEWEEAIDKNLRTADIVLLLVSRDFMASDYVYEKEISIAVGRHERGDARVIPVIVRPADWEWASFGRLQALPKDAKPITRWPDPDDAWLDVVTGVRRAVDELSIQRQEREAANLHELGQQYFDDREHERALRVYEQISRVKPDLARAWFWKGNALFSLGRLEEALEEYDKALSLDPNDTSAWYSKSAGLFNLGRGEEALEACEKLLSLEPNLNVAWRQKGKILGKLGRLEESLEAFDRALSLNPDYAEAWTEKGGILGKLGRLEEALEAFDRALSLMPERPDPDTWQVKGVALQELGRTEEARKAFEKAKALRQTKT